MFPSGRVRRNQILPLYNNSTIWKNQMCSRYILTDTHQLSVRSFLSENRPWLRLWWGLYCVVGRCEVRSYRCWCPRPEDSQASPWGLSGLALRTLSPRPEDSQSSPWKGIRCGRRESHTLDLSHRSDTKGEELQVNFSLSWQHSSQSSVKVIFASSDDCSQLKERVCACVGLLICLLPSEKF